jgi:hypothetical protein
VDVISAYIAELEGALCGPRRLKADLLAEARDGLADAAAAYQRHGMCREVAERRAVRDFGAAADIARGYQIELGLAQGWRTALLIFCCLVAQPVAWGQIRHWMAPAWTAAAPPLYAIVAEFLKLFGGLVLLAALIAVVASSRGVRYLGAGAGPGLVRAIGVLALAISVVLAVTGMLMPVLRLSVTGLLWTVVALLLPLAWIVVSARRCLTAGAGPAFRPPRGPVPARRR